ncbi:MULTISPECIES: extracellular solute-binding protein [Campylobacter]|uniref:Extracellular solute-binding protein n=1 Tax=Campylobacter vicugnae TaxID=1660076 RepID=A0ABZ2E830_9BACT|nr:MULTISPECIES: extracellular solute-binding protein [unclassified Campylobacter]MCR8690434.1 extracellular solute-binding protein [Campylobacter sp. RM9264]MCR8701708.1 extracellular solute-binding protein [Campylobacter sp. RM12176]
MKKLLLTAAFACMALANEINLYSGKGLDPKLANIFESQTGIKINIIKDKEQMAKMNAPDSKADLFMGMDVSTFAKLQNDDKFAPAKSKIIDSIVPANLKDKNNEWIGLSKRARVIVYDKKAIDPKLIQNYEDLAKPELKGKLLMRTSNVSFNRSLLASIIANDGEDKAKEWAKGTLNNLARDPKGGDREQARGVYEGIGAVGVMNSYYIITLLNSKKQSDQETAKSLGVIFPNQDGRGTHINITGIALLKSSQNKDSAIKFIEFMLSKEAQEILVSTSHEYPVNKDAKPSKEITALGKFKEDSISLNKVANELENAQKIYKELGWK